MTGRSGMLHGSNTYGVWGSSRTLTGSQLRNKLIVVYPDLSLKYAPNFVGLAGNTKSLSNSLLANSFNYSLPFAINAYDARIA